jgi:hypothetical protein
MIALHNGSDEADVTASIGFTTRRWRDESGVFFLDLHVQAVDLSRLFGRDCDAADDCANAKSAMASDEAWERWHRPLMSKRLRSRQGGYWKYRSCGAWRSPTLRT